MKLIWFILLCVWSSVSIFSETRIYFNEYREIAQIDLSKIKYPSIVISLEDEEKD